MKDVKSEIKKIVQGIVIKPRGTPEGDAQREDFKRRWGKKPQDL